MGLLQEIWSLHTSELKDKNFHILFLVTGQRNQLKYAQMVLQVQGLVLNKLGK